MKESLSQQAFKKAQQILPGGVNSPVRAFKNVNSSPFFIQSGKGSKITDIDGNKYIDYVQSWGPLILGHAHPEVLNAVQEALAKGWTYGAPCEIETQLAEKVNQLFPSMEMMRFVSSGTEAAMGAIRLARGATQRELIIKCDGGYHGHSDALLVSAGSGLATLGTSSSQGVPDSFAKTTIVVPVNHLEALEQAFKAHQDNIAAFVLEPISGNIGVIPPEDGYLKACREICNQHGVKLIFDEVMCGFRADLRGAQSLYGVRPDITILGKVIGGGFPVGAYGASKELMQLIAPCGPVYQAGTLSGNPVAMTAGLKTLELLEQGAFEKALSNTDQLINGISEILEKKQLPFQINRVGTMFSLFLMEGPVSSYQDVSKVDTELFAKFHRILLEKGVYFAPSPYEASFMSSSHSKEDIDQTLQALEEALSQLF